MSNQQTWFILNNGVDSDQIKRIYKYHTQPNPYYLFDQTPLAEIKEQGPYVLRVDNSSKFIQSYLEDSQLWHGIMLETNATPDQLLSHLRNLLLVRFETEQKGILNYYHQQVATYFMQMPEYLLPFWLGPINKVTWYGATWQDKYYNTEKLYQIANPQPSDNYIQAEPSLTEEQLALLNKCEQEQAIYRLSNTLELDYQQIATYQQEAEQLGFKDQAALKQYILLREDNLTQPIPNKELVGVTTIDKLTILRQYWQQHTGVTA